MMNRIIFQKVTKTYQITKGKYGLITDVIGNNFPLFRKKLDLNLKTVKALKNVSFTVGHGETIGIIGRNGAGKSTILKLISKISYPNMGKVTVNGRIGAFIELGAGLHPELTGKENIYLYGSILGMTRGEIKSKFNDIVEFAEIKKFLDLPIKKFSSGMYSRLGFSVCAFCDPDILLVDEVLAVGDTYFQKKCLDKMKSFAGKKTIIFVSHDLKAIKEISDRVFYIERGSILKSGNPKKVIDFYLKNGEDTLVL